MNQMLTGEFMEYEVIVEEDALKNAEEDAQKSEKGFQLSNLTKVASSSFKSSAMAISKALIASILISILVFHLVEADQMVNTDTTKGSPSKKIDCGAACSARCQLSSRPNLCKRACGTCCARCSCVPPGTSGNRDLCYCGVLGFDRERGTLAEIVSSLSLRRNISSDG
ncbi:hypothetical protein CMV_028711 [Castanea mollissima]|uniref:Uncharacterized protein n=1 Tax=Castanea mollissima TaxID=60419 RepID=A0A8J4QE33_9ROSI|nr:hypothetical protein CMV_028711 [Castanea mollissima]